MIEKLFGKEWTAAIGESTLESTLSEISEFLYEERQSKTIFPPAGSDLLFKAFRDCPLDKVKVVILGMDPYHTDGAYNGFAFGNGAPDEDAKKVKIQPSLRNVLKEVEREFDNKPHPSLMSWVNQGVLLINTAHSVEKGNAGSHIGLWSGFTTAVINALNEKDDVVWMLWGGNAKAYAGYISNPTHKVITTGHPSPLNRVHPFVGSGCFSKCNEMLDEPIVWA